MNMKLSLRRWHPAPPTPEQDDEERQRILGMCIDYLSQQQTVLWGRSYNLHDQKSRRQAADWFAAEIEAVFGWRQ